MPELTNWKDDLVVQKDHKLGAIPAGFEWMIRFAKIKNVNFDTFQDDFNLKNKGIGENNFDSIASAIIKKYPHLKINIKTFDRGSEKFDFIYDLIKNNIPCIMSLTLSAKSPTTHQMPVYFCDDIYIRLVWKMDKTDNPDILRVERDEIVNRHNRWQGGKEITWIEI